MKRFLIASTLLLSAVLLVPSEPRAQAADPTATPREMVAAYESLATTLISAKATEWNLVGAILSATFGHAQATWSTVKAKLQGGQNARADVERLATLVAQLGN